MARPQSEAKLGYYPLLPEYRELLWRLFSQIGGQRTKYVEYGCADGEHMDYVSSLFNLDMYGVEISDMAHEAIAKYGANNVLHHDAHDIDFTQRLFGVVFVNPPYQQDRLTTEAALNEDLGKRRAEYRAVRDWKTMTQDGGYFVIVIYAHHMSASMFTTLSDTFNVFNVFRFPGKHLGNYDQVAIICQMDKSKPMAVTPRKGWRVEYRKKGKGADTRIIKSGIIDTVENAFSYANERFRQYMEAKGVEPEFEKANEKLYKFLDTEDVRVTINWRQESVEERIERIRSVQQAWVELGQNPDRIPVLKFQKDYTREEALALSPEERASVPKDGMFVLPGMSPVRHRFLKKHLSNADVLRKMEENPIEDPDYLTEVPPVRTEITSIVDPRVNHVIKFAIDGVVVKYKGKDCIARTYNRRKSKSVGISKEADGTETATMINPSVSNITLIDDTGTIHLLDNANDVLQLFEDNKEQLGPLLRDRFKVKFDNKVSLFLRALYSVVKIKGSHDRFKTQELFTAATIEKLLTDKTVVLAADMGSGKSGAAVDTMIALSIIERIKERHPEVIDEICEIYGIDKKNVNGIKPGKVIVVAAPANMTLEWKKTIQNQWRIAVSNESIAFFEEIGRMDILESVANLIPEVKIHTIGHVNSKKGDSDMWIVEAASAIRQAEYDAEHNINRVHVLVSSFETMKLGSRYMLSYNKSVTRPGGYIPPFASHVGDPHTGFDLKEGVNSLVSYNEFIGYGDKLDEDGSYIVADEYYLIKDGERVGEFNRVQERKYRTIKVPYFTRVRDVVKKGVNAPSNGVAFSKMVKKVLPERETAMPFYSKSVDEDTGETFWVCELETITIPEKTIWVREFESMVDGSRPADEWLHMQGIRELKTFKRAKQVDKAMAKHNVSTYLFGSGIPEIDRAMDKNDIVFHVAGGRQYYRNPRMELAWYLSTKAKGSVGLTIVDECHKIAGLNTDIGKLVNNLMWASDKVLNMSGTPFNGMLDSIYRLYFYSSAEFRRDFPWTGSADAFCQKYGVWEWKEFNYKEEEKQGVFTGVSRGKKSDIKMIPGFTPEVLRYTMPHTIYVLIDDLGQGLPDLEEIVTEVKMSKDMRERTQSAETDTAKYIRGDTSSAREANDIPGFFSSHLAPRFSGASWQYRLRLPDSMAIGDTVFLHKNTLFDPDLSGITDKINSGKIDRSMASQILHEINNETVTRNIKTQNGFLALKGLKRDAIVHHSERLDVDMLPKEIELINALDYRINMEGRRCIVHMCQTGDDALLYRIKGLIEEHVENAKPFVMMANSPHPSKRMEYIESMVEEGYNVILCNPSLIQEGVNMDWFSYTAYMEIHLVLATMSQSARRTRRISNHSRDVVVQYFIYDDIVQNATFFMIANRLASSNMLSGKGLDDGVSSKSNIIPDDSDMVNMFKRDVEELQAELSKGSSIDIDAYMNSPFYVEDTRRGY